MQTPPPQFPGYGPQGPAEHSNYPRQMPYGYGPVPPRPPEVSLGAIRDSWELMTQDLGTWVLASLILIVILFVVSVPLIGGINYVAFGSVFGSPNPELSARFLLLQIVQSAIVLGLITPFMGGIYWMCLKRIRAQEYGLRDLFYGLRHFPALAVAGFFTGLLTYLGFLLCIVPGLYMMGVLVFAPLVAMDQKCGGLEAVRLSYQALRPHGLMMFGLIFVLNLIVGFSGMLCGVPVLFTVPVYCFTIALHYHAFFPPQESRGAVPAMPVSPQYSV